MRDWDKLDGGLYRKKEKALNDDLHSPLTVSRIRQEEPPLYRPIRSL